MSYRIVNAGLEDPISRQLLAEHRTELRKRYPEGVANFFGLDSAEVTADRGAFVIAVDAAGAPLGCGAVRVLRPGLAELHRVYVRPIARGLGVGSALLANLEDTARALEATELLLETGVRQDEALGLFWKSGFSEISAFADYVDSPLSVCMAKSLDQRTAGMTATPSISTRAWSSHSRLTPIPAEAG